MNPRTFVVLAALFMLIGAFVALVADDWRDSSGQTPAESVRQETTSLSPSLASCDIELSVRTRNGSRYAGYLIEDCDVTDGSVTLASFTQQSVPTILSMSLGSVVWEESLELLPENAALICLTIQDNEAAEGSDLIQVCEPVN